VETHRVRALLTDALSPTLATCDGLSRRPVSSSREVLRSSEQAPSADQAGSPEPTTPRAVVGRSHHHRQADQRLRLTQLSALLDIIYIIGVLCRSPERGRIRQSRPVRSAQSFRTPLRAAQIGGPSGRTFSTRCRSTNSRTFVSGLTAASRGSDRLPVWRRMASSTPWAPKPSEGAIPRQGGEGINTSL
jgi:hypothetical protein